MFYYVDDMLKADGECDLAVATRIRNAYQNCHDSRMECLPIFKGKGLSLKLKGKVCTSLSV